MRTTTVSRGRREFALVLRRGRAVFDEASRLSLRYAPRGTSVESKVGIVITKKVGNAVVRNRLRRRCKAILDESGARRVGTWYVVQCAGRPRRP